MVRKWTPESKERLKFELGCTSWLTLTEPHGEDVNGALQCVTAYVNHIKDQVAPARKVRCYANNKPWISSDLKSLLNKKKRAFKAWDMDGVKEVQKDIKKALREGRNIHKAKLEDKLQRNNVREVWSGMRAITGYKLATGEEEGSLKRVNEMNEHFIRLGLAPLAQSPSAPVTTSDTQIIQPLPPFPSLSPTPPELTGTHPGLIITADQMILELCHSQEPPNPVTILHHLDRIKPPLCKGWRVMQAKDFLQYGKLEEFVSSVSETASGLLSYRHRAVLTLELQRTPVLSSSRFHSRNNMATSGTSFLGSGGGVSPSSR
ncbi:hypothetical protein AAFF_G00338650 [Aldrovandia affinis]|uniref:TERF1-interacting nuclear factor 2 N-terminal domain-containing protein n=1 Tax=Aldrovandia affinis TaxID=143900 RepID=A0AAD7R6P1_9TELE|nr:hypothetical protein AAFF_G00338650 [Aldrovandia affinis]